MTSNNHILYLAIHDNTGIALIVIFLVGFVGLIWVASTFDN